MALPAVCADKPQFAVLDECTSAVSIDVEEELYLTAIRQGITCVTISQRLSLPECHAPRPRDRRPCTLVRGLEDSSAHGRTSAGHTTIHPDVKW
jgi:hypothetical protein